MSILEPVPPVDERDHVRGAVTPVVTIIEYGDYECPHTRAAQSVVDQLVAENPDVRVVFRHFPLRQIHPHAESLARVAEAAGHQELFWRLHDHLMAQPKSLNERSAILEAQKLGLDPERLRTDAGGRVVIAAVERHVQGGLKSGVHSTPTFFFEGSRHDGSYDLLTLREHVEEARIRATAPRSRISRA